MVPPRICCDVVDPLNGTISVVLRFRRHLCLHHHSISHRNFVWINVTTNPTAEWIARQITEAFPWSEAPRYLSLPKIKSVRIDGAAHQGQAALRYAQRAE
jgi:hypothetical protein